MMVLIMPKAMKPIIITKVNSKPDKGKQLQTNDTDRKCMTIKA